MSEAHLKSRRFSRKYLAAVLVLAVVIIGVSAYVYYSMGVTSITSVSIYQVLADRKILNGTAPNRSATFLFEIQVRSAGQSITIKLDKPIFLANMQGIRLGNQTLDSGTLLPGSSLTYNLRFTVSENKVGYFPFSSTAHNVVLGMVTHLTAGFYSAPVSLCDSTTWNWTTASLVSDFGSSNNCVV